jgi:DNA polymerase-4
LSLDEAFIEMTGAEGLFGPPDEMGEAIKRAVREATGLTVSVGVSGTKYVAKVASAYRKPDGLTVVPPEEARTWLAPLPVSRLWGAGPQMQQRLHDCGLATIGDVGDADPAALRRSLGRSGEAFHALAQGLDPRPVEAARRSKSIGSERTLAEDVSDPADIAHHLRGAADAVGRRLRANRYRANGIRVKLKRSDFRLLSRQRTLTEPSDRTAEIYRAAVALLAEFDEPGPFRLVGVAAYDLVRAEDVAQLGLLDADGRKSAQLDSVLDALDARFGSGTVQRAANLVRPSGIGPEVNLDFLNTDTDD